MKLTYNFHENNWTLFPLWLEKIFISVLLLMSTLIYLPKLRVVCSDWILAVMINLKFQTTIKHFIFKRDEFFIAQSKFYRSKILYNCLSIMVQRIKLKYSNIPAKSRKRQSLLCTKTWQVAYEVPTL